MQTAAELRSLLTRIDRRGYPAYKDARGTYQFPNYILSIDHVQGDPFAAPSRLSILVKGRAAGFPPELYDRPHRRIALQDQLTRRFGAAAERFSFQAKGSGQSGLIAVSRCGQEVLERTACRLDPKSGDVLMRFEVGFPANGRTVNAGELGKILLDFLPKCAEQALFYPLIEGYMLQNMWCYLATEAALLVAILFGAAVVRLKAWIGYAVTAAALAVMLWTGFDARTEYMLRMSSEAYFNRWDRVLAAADRNWDYKSYVGSYYTDLALAREGRLGDELMKYYQPASNALLLAINEKSGYIYAMAGCDAQIEMGDLAQAQHTAMLAMTFTPRQRSSRVARRLAEIAIIAGDYELADKFLRQLEYGLFHRRWAAERRRLLADEELLSAQPEVAVKRSLLSRSDTLFSPNDWFRSLYNLLESNPSNRMARDYLMCYHLLNKDMRRFKADYDRYCFADAARAGIPKYYEQALVMCLGAEPDAVEQYVRYGVSEATYAECLDYLAAYERAGGDGRQLMERFGDSYWFYYYYAQIK